MHIFSGGDISYDEMVILMSSALSAMVRFNNNLIGSATDLPDDQKMENITDEAFLDADANMNGTIHKAEFREWVVKRLAQDNMEVTATDILRAFGLVEKADDDNAGESGGEFGVETAGGGDQASTMDNTGPASSNGPWLTVKVKGIGEVQINYVQEQGIFTFTAGGESCRSSDEGFDPQDSKSVRKLATMKAQKLKLVTTKASRTSKSGRPPSREAQKTLVLPDKWEDKHELSDYLQLMCSSLSGREKALRARKEMLEARVADLQQS
jgi:hypothetical protein